MGHCFGCCLQPGTNDNEAEVVYEDTDNTLVSIDSPTVSEAAKLNPYAHPLNRLGSLQLCFGHEPIAIWEIANQYNYKAVEFCLQRYVVQEAYRNTDSVPATAALSIVQHHWLLPCPR